MSKAALSSLEKMMLFPATARNSSPTAFSNPRRRHESPKCSSLSRAETGEELCDTDKRREARRPAATLGMIDIVQVNAEGLPISGGN